MDGNSTRKEILASDVHKTKSRSSITESSVVSRYSVQLYLTIADLNHLEIFACEIGDEYLNDNFSEKLWTVSGIEFGSEKVSVVIISKALYGLKLVGT